MSQSALDSMAHELLTRGEGFTFIARGQSMWPHILDGDVIELQPKLGQVRIGDVVFIPTGDFGVLHRVIAVAGDGKVLTRGDALREPDGWSMPEQITGVLKRVRRHGNAVNVPGGRTALHIANVLGRLRRIVHRIRHR